VTEHSTLTATATALTQTAEAALDALDNNRDAPTSDIVRTRLHAAQTAGAAVALEVRLAGGTGFLATSPTARRHREAAFLPIQTPTESQLLLELG
jgi:alkylation response protein AidB-like acyl-CoA dehydrogenase